MERIYHTWDKWECYPAGFYEPSPRYAELSKLTREELEGMYAAFLSSDERFRFAIRRLIIEWKNSCEHYLSNENMNRIAWIGQASACIACGLPSDFRGGFNLLSKAQQDQANTVALEGLNTWLTLRGERPLSAEEAESQTEMNLY